MTDRILIYAKLPDQTGGCEYCDRAKEFLADRNIPFEVEELTPEQRQALYDKLGLEDKARTVPQVMIIDSTDEVHRIGGYANLIHSNLEGLFR